MQVPMHDFAAEYRSMQVEIDEAVRRVLLRGQPAWGPEVPAFEAEFARFVSARSAVGTNTGMAALRAALLALGIGPGDEVITVPNAGIYTTAPIHHVGARAVWVDVEPDTLNLDPDAVAAAITPRTRGIVPVHLYGHPADMPALRAIADRNGLFIVEDACIAVGASIDGQPVGSWGEVTCFSFAPTKQLGAFGAAGIAVTNDADLAQKLQLYAGYGYPRSDAYSRNPIGRGQRLEVEGLNERLDELRAAILRAKLPHVTGWITTRRRQAQSYTDALQGSSMQPPVERPAHRHTYRNYVIRAADRTHIQTRLAEAGIASSTLYAPPLHLQPAYRHLGHKRGSFPIVEAAGDTLFSIPVRPSLTEAQRDHLVETLSRIGEKS